MQNKHSASPLLVSSPESFTNVISISDSLDDFCLPTLSFFEDILSLFLLLVSLRAKRISSPDNPATPSCKEKQFIVLHSSLLIVLLDIWEQNILVFDEE